MKKIFSIDKMISNDLASLKGLSQEFYDLLSLSKSDDVIYMSSAFRIFIEYSNISLDEITEALRFSSLSPDNAVLSVPKCIALKLAFLQTHRKEFWPINMMDTHPNLFLNIHKESRNSIIELTGFVQEHLPFVNQRSALSHPVFKRLALIQTNALINLEGNYIGFKSKDGSKLGYLIDYKTIAQFLSHETIRNEKDVKDALFNHINTPVLALKFIEKAKMVFPDEDNVSKEVSKYIHGIIRTREKGSDWALNILPYMIDRLCKKPDDFLTNTHALALSELLRSTEVASPDDPGYDHSMHFTSLAISKNFDKLIRMIKSLEKISEDYAYDEIENQNLGSLSLAYHLVSTSIRLLCKEKVIEIASRQDRDIQKIFMEKGISPTVLRNLDKKDRHQALTRDLGL